MVFCKCLNDFISPELSADKEASRAVEEFLKKIPNRVLQIDVDLTKSNKQGVTDGDKVYKLGYVMESGLIFVEYFEQRSQGEPSMGLYVDKEKSSIMVKGWKVDKKFLLVFKVKDGEVTKTSRLE